MAEPVQASHAQEEPHHEQSFWRKFIFSTDHKVIGVQYSVTGLAFLFFGFCLMMIMRWQLAYPGEAIPFIGSLLGDSRAPGGIMLPDFYNELGAMHGTIMVFLGVVPLAVGGFGNFIMPLQLGAPDMAFPRINMISYWCLFMGGVTMFASFFLPTGAAANGWTSYSPLSDIALNGQTAWLIGMIFLITSSLLGAINFITTRGASPGARDDLDAPAVLLLVADRHRLPAAARLPAARSSQRAAVDGPGRFHQLLPARRPGGRRRGAGSERRRQSTALAAPVLVPGASRGLRPDPAGDGHRGRGHCQQLAEAALGLPLDGVLADLPRLHELHRLGATTCSSPAWVR